MAIRKSFSLQNLGAYGIHWRDKSEQSAKVLSTKIVFYTNSRKFSPLKVSRYTVTFIVNGDLCMFVLQATKIWLWSANKAIGSMCAHIQTELFTETETESVH